MGNKQAEGRGPGGHRPAQRPERTEPGEGETCALMTGCQEGRAREIRTSLPHEQSNKFREPGQEGAKEVTRSGRCGWQPPETEGRGARETPKRLQGSTLEANPTLAASFLPLLTEVRETQKVEEAEQEGPRAPGEVQELISGNAMENLPGGPMVKSPCSQTGGVCSILGQGTKIAHAAWHPPKKKYKKRNATVSTEKGSRTWGHRTASFYHNTKFLLQNETHGNFFTSRPGSICVENVLSPTVRKQWKRSIFY